MSLRTFFQLSGFNPLKGPMPVQTPPAPFEPSLTSRPRDFVVFSHLRWDFVFQRPQHLLTRCAQTARVFYMEEPVFDASTSPGSLKVRHHTKNIWVVVPHLPAGMGAPEVSSSLGFLVNDLLTQENISEFVSWYYTPMALAFTRHLKPSAIIYDCMDELSLFQGAPAELLELERELFRRADVVFTGGRTLFEHKKAHHANIHAFPSSIDANHFGKARDPELTEAVDQQSIRGPKIGYFGVIDERMNLELLAQVAAQRPDWSLVILGPVVKIDPADLPQANNIHYLGSKSYDDLPSYVKGWDVAMLPFALNDSTRFISPTKTPEYLAAGVPVVSTSIRDVRTPYGDQGLALIADTAPDFIQAVETHLAMPPAGRTGWLEGVDAFLSGLSWDHTWSQMSELIELAAAAPVTAHARLRDTSFDSGKTKRAAS